MPASGTSTGDNDKFLRLWFEISEDKFYNLVDDKNYSVYKWFGCNKGGDYRKWYGNNSYVIDWENDGYNIKNIRDERGKLKSRPLNLDKLFLPNITWSKVGNGPLSLRFSKSGFINESIGASIYKKILI